MINKKLLGTMVAVCSIASVQAKDGLSKFSGGIFGGVTVSHTDATPNKSAGVFGITGKYEPVKYVGINLTISNGTLTGGENTGTTMYYKNNFTQADVTLRVMPLAIFHKYMSKYPAFFYFEKIYGGVGAGIMNSNTKINKLNLNVFNFMSDYKGTDLIIPVDFGIEIPLHKPASVKGFGLNLNYRINYCTTDKMDGYDPNLPSNKSKDMYNAATLGVIYKF